MEEHTAPPTSHSSAPHASVPAAAQPAPPAPPQRSSNRGCWLAVALAAIVLLIGLGALMLGFFAMVGRMGANPVKVSDGSWLEINLSGAMAEAPPEVDLGPLFSVYRASLWDLRRALDAAADDGKIEGIRLWVHDSAFGFATAEEIVFLIDRFREASGKPVHAILQADMVSDLDYFLATSADRIWATPVASAVINGFSSEAQFMRGALEKLHIEPEVLMYKEYKSAGEQFANYEMSPYMRESLGAVLDSFSRRWVERVSQRRGLGPEAVESFLQVGMRPITDLVEAGLVDELGFMDQIQSGLSESVGMLTYEGIRLRTYVQSLSSGSFAFKDRIAVVFGEGQIVSQPLEASFPSFFGASLFSGPVVAANIRRAAEDPNVKAIVFRVNSPGGSAVGSDLVDREIQRARESGKPVVVSMSDVAGSGGYWVSMSADAIVAQPTTITGSIGVVFQKLTLEGFWEWLGIGIDTVKTDDNADIFGSGPLGPEDLAAIESWMDQAYDQFTRSVAQSRDLELEHVLDVARGRIWSGSDAIERGLVDELGGLDTAVRLAKEKAGLDGDEAMPLVVYPRPKTLFQQLSEGGLVTARSPLPTRAELETWVRWMARPQVQALMPEIRVY